MQFKFRKSIRSAGIDGFQTKDRLFNIQHSISEASRLLHGGWLNVTHGQSSSVVHHLRDLIAIGQSLQRSGNSQETLLQRSLKSSNNEQLYTWNYSVPCTSISFQVNDKSRDCTENPTVQVNNLWASFDPGGTASWDILRPTRKHKTSQTMVIWSVATWWFSLQKELMSERYQTWSSVTNVKMQQIGRNKPTILDPTLKHHNINKYVSRQIM